MSASIFWLFGFALMFGAPGNGFLGWGARFAFDAPDTPQFGAFFLFQLGFAGTAATIVSGAVAERMRFGPAVEAIVLDCTESRGEEGSPAPWFDRKCSHLAHLLAVASTDRARSTARVVGADKLANVNSMIVDDRRDPQVWERFKGGLGGTVWYHRRMAVLISEMAPGSMIAEELASSSATLERILARESAGREAVIARVDEVLDRFEPLATSGASPYLAFELGRAAASEPSGEGDPLTAVLARWSGEAAADSVIDPPARATVAALLGGPPS